MSANESVESLCDVDRPGFRFPINLYANHFALTPGFAAFCFLVRLGIHSRGFAIQIDHFYANQLGGQVLTMVLTDIDEDFFE